MFSFSTRSFFLRSGAVLALTFTASLPQTAHALPPSATVLAKMKFAANYWISNNPTGGDYQWASATFQVGCLACFDATQDLAYYNHTTAWAESLNWQIHNGIAVTSTSPNWSADDMCAGQSFLRLHQLKPGYTKPIDIKRVGDELVAINPPDYLNEWWWVDSLHMSMPAFVQLANQYSSSSYTNLMYYIFNFLKQGRTAGGYPILYDTYAVSPFYATHLWYRDGSHSFPTRQTPNGLKELWSRGNAWAFIALAKTLRDLPTSDANYSTYLTTFQEMALAIAGRQRSDGFWNESLDDTAQFAGPETSGTAGFTFGLALGVNRGWLSSTTYLPIITKAWDDGLGHGMVPIALQSSGLLGYIQGWGGAPGEPASEHPLTSATTHDYGVGAFLMAGSEVVKLCSDYVAPAAVTIPDAPNLCRQTGVLITFSSQQTGNEATHAIDGDTVNTRWSGAAPTYPQWVRVNFGANKSVGKTKIYPLQGRAYQYKIEGTIDGVNYFTLVDKTTNTVGGTVLIDEFPARTAKFVKLTVVGATGYTGGWSSINEFEVYPW